MQEPRYINPYTDFGFKKLFGSELNKELLISFLNALLEGEQEI
ncbi:MAG: PD-(D/E)XK nuclease family transposase, partial [Bacteroidales bacterium]|nr:PD-(D/E)XK nuclease family transposase [Bacteroidales bacterium]